MHGPLKVFSTDKFIAGNVTDMIDQYGAAMVHLLISDGIMVDFRHAFPDAVRKIIMVQRVLTSYQLQRILMESDSNPHYIALASAVVNSWHVSVVSGIYDIMRIKSYYHGCPIHLNIIGDPGVMARYLGARKIGLEAY